MDIVLMLTVFSDADKLSCLGRCAITNDIQKP